MKKYLAVILATLLFAIGLLAIPSQTAQASNSGVPSGTAEHCVVEAFPIGAEPSNPSPLVCFDNFADAIAHATNGRVHLPQNFKPTDLTDDLLNMGKDVFSRALTPDTITSTVIAIDYDGINRQGNTLVTQVSDGNGCLNTNWARSSLGAGWPWGWDNVIGSAEAFQNCNHSYHYEHQNFQGAVLDCGTYCSSMGVMDNQSSSIAWTH